MKLLPFALLILLVGCATYEPAPIDWVKESTALTAAPRKIELSVDDVRVRTVAFSPVLNALRQTHAASKAKAAASGWWEDPALNADFLRILSAPENPLVYGGSLAFTAEADRWALVAAERDAAGEAAVEAVTARETAAFARTLERTLDGTNYVAALDVARRLADVGELPRADYEQLVADSREWRRTAFELGHERATAEAALREKMMLSPTCEITWTDAGREAQMPTNVFAALDFTNAPSVRAAVARLAGGELELDREIRRQYPELSFGPAYTREDGYNRLGITGGLTLQPAGDHRGPHASALEPQPRGHRHGHGHARRGAPCGRDGMAERRPPLARPQAGAGAPARARRRLAGRRRKRGASLRNRRAGRRRLRGRRSPRAHRGADVPAPPNRFRHARRTDEIRRRGNVRQGRMK